MHPVLFELALPDGTLLEVSSYRVAYMVAAAVALVIAWVLARRDGLPARSSLAVLLAAAIALPAGARLWHAATNPEVYVRDPWRLWTLQASGHALFGGILAAAIAGVLASRLLRVDAWRLADAATPALGAGIAIMRMGCFANGCCFGVPTGWLTGVTFPAGSYAHFWEIAHGHIKLFETPLPVHPTQLYEAVGALACVALWAVVRGWQGRPPQNVDSGMADGAPYGASYAIGDSTAHDIPENTPSDIDSGLPNGTDRGVPSGVPFLSFIGAFAVVRALNWAFRVPPDTLTEPGIYWAIYPAAFAICLGLIAARFITVRRSAANRES